MQQFHSKPELGVQLAWLALNINNIQFPAPDLADKWLTWGPHTGTLQDPGMFRASSARGERRGEENKYLKFFVRAEI